MNFKDELQEKTAALPSEREISLGTGTILGIFLALTLVCAGFFGFGYSMGRRSEKAAIAPAPESTTALKSDASPFSGFRASPPVASPATPAVDQPTPQTVSETTPPVPSSQSVATDPSASSAADGTVVQPPVSPDGTWMVQVSATTRKPDAEALSKVLVRQGFTTSIRPDPDQKFHVRVGPFAAKKDADTTRKLLVASGYKDPFVTLK